MRHIYIVTCICVYKWLLSNADNNLNCVKVINKPCMTWSRCMSLLPRTTLHSDGEQLPPLIMYFFAVQFDPIIVFQHKFPIYKINIERITYLTNSTYTFREEQAAVPIPGVQLGRYRTLGYPLTLVIYHFFFKKKHCKL